MNKLKSIFIKIALIMLPLVLSLAIVVLVLVYNITYENSLIASKETIRDTAEAAVQYFEAFNLYDSQDALENDEMVSRMCDMFNITYLFALSIDPEENSETYLAIGFGENASEKAKNERFPGVKVTGVLSKEELLAYNGDVSGVIEHERNQYDDSLVCYMPCTRYFDVNKMDYVYYDKPILIGAEISLKSVNQSIQNRFHKFAIMTIITTVMLVLLFAVILYFKVTKPIRLISDRMSSFVTDREKGMEKLPVKGHDELAQMAASFNTMTDEIDRYINDIDALNREKHTQEAELNIARNIQKGLLRPELTKTPAADIRAYMLPAKNVGGDLYDYYFADDGRIFVSVADVAGKGISAALFMSRAITLLNQYAQLNYTPSQCLAEYNNTLASQNPGGLFITTFLAIYDPSTGRLTYSNAGHNILYVISDTLIRLEGSHGVAAGLFEGEEYENAFIDLKPGDTLFLYTDGVNEAKNAKGAFYSTEKLEEKLTACIGSDSDDIIKEILSDLNSFTQGAEQNDDITMLTLRIKPRQSEIILRLTSDTAQLTHIKEAIFRLDLSEDLKRTIYLAAEEMFVNICSYAYETPGEVELRLSVGDRVKLTLTDGGKPFDPTVDLLDIDEYDHENRIGGLGRFLTFSIADEYRYEYRGGKNILTLYFIKGD